MERVTSVDMTSHGGLRGVAAVWVMLFHFVLFSKFPLDFQGSSLMPLFFLLSGFSLTISYGSMNPNSRSDGDGNFEIHKANFYQNRFARVYPVYFVCILIALYVAFMGYGDIPPIVGYVVSSLVVSVIPVCTFFIFLLGGCIDGPGWTVCTLAVMWYRFPYSLKVVKEKTDAELALGMTKLFYTQLALVFIVFILLIGILGFWPAFAAATMNPIVRYPLFLMGVYAAELCLRFPMNAENPVTRNGVTLTQLLPAANMMLFPGGDNNYDCFGARRMVNVAACTESPEYWSGIAYSHSFRLLILTMSVSVMDALVRYVGGVQTGILGAVWLQAIVPFSQLMVIVSITRDAGVSVPSQFLRSPLLSWLGNLSMCIYLIHYPVMQYVRLLLNGGKFVQWPSVYDCGSNYDEGSSEYDQCENTLDDFLDTRSIPVWSIPVCVVLSMGLAVLMYHLIEGPARKFLKVTQSQTHIPIMQHNDIDVEMTQTLR